MKIETDPVKMVAIESKWQELCDRWYAHTGYTPPPRPKPTGEFCVICGKPLTTVEITYGCYDCSKRKTKIK